MAESGKKISFSFSKVVKQPRITKGPTKDANDKQYIDCLDSKSIIVKDDDVSKSDEGPKEIVIPLRNPTVSRSSDPQKQKDADANALEVKSETVGNGAVSLEDIAAKELLEESKRISEQQKNENTNTFEIPTPQSEENLQKESTLEDYEMIPVEAFGKAMLRGMGWTAGKGIGKQGQVAAMATPQVRPRGMGLGADKAVSKTSASNPKQEEEPELELLKGSYVQVASGARKGQYGEVQGMDEDAGRLVVKMALSGDCVSVSEHAVRVVSKKEYDKNSRVLNVAKFDDYKKRSERREDSHDKSSDRNSDRHRNYSSSKKRHKRSPSPPHKHSRHRTSS